jgi:cysteinyl-tRNA synthetase
MALRLFNTRTHTAAPFRPLIDGQVGIYVCGLTPSAAAHLGHARSFLFFDVLRRYLEHPRNGYRVTYVQNVTDVDDRSIRTAAEEGTTFDAVMQRFYGSFRESMNLLNVRVPDIEPHVTAYVPQIVAMIDELIANGNAYVTDDGVYYRVASFPRYGQLSGKNTEELLIGARIAENEAKDDPLDFALWKFAKPGEPQWESPWGGGRPGWHIECSAMSRLLLGVPFDIHGGGFDLIFPHHENEIAQSEVLMPAPPMTEVWLHGGLLNFEGRKMSKSLGNFEPLSALLERTDPMAIRLLFLQTGYRKPMNFTEDSIASAAVALERIIVARAELPETSDDAGARERFFAALDDDMNTAGAVGVLFSEVVSGGRGGRAFLDEALAVLGLGPVSERAPKAPAAFTLPEDLLARLSDALKERLGAHGWAAVEADPEAAMLGLIEARKAARASKDFSLSDQLRDELAAAGIALKDGKDGTTWTPAAG